MEQEQNATVKQEVILPNEVQEAKSRGFEVFSISAGEKEFFFRKPNKIDVKVYMDANVRDKNNAFSHTERAVKSLLLCDQEGFSAYLEEKPLSIGFFFEELFGEIGANEKLLKKKV